MGDTDPTYEWSLPTYLADTCQDGNPALWKHFAQCVRTPQQLVGFAFGCIALIFWLFAHILVITRRHFDGFKRHRLIPGHQLLHESAADVLNCLGAVLSHQLGTQVLFGVYLLCIDSLFMIQFLTLKTLTECAGRGLKTLKEGKKKDTDRQLNLLTWPLLLFAATSIGYNMHPSGSAPTGHSQHTGRILLSVTTEHYVDNTMKLGYVIGYLSILFHWTAAIPRAIRTFQDRHMSWNHLVYASFAILGNLCYVISVFCHHSNVHFFVHTLPWTLGRLGMIGIDVGLVAISIVHRYRGTHVEPATNEKRQLLGGSDSDTSSELSEDSDTWMPLTQLRKGKRLRKIKPQSKHTSDSDGSLEEVTTTKKSPMKSNKKMSLKAPTPLSCDGGSDTGATSTESEVYDVISEEKKEERKHRSNMDTHADSDKSGTPKNEASEDNEDKAVFDNDTSIFVNEQGELVTINEEEIVDLQQN